MDDLRASTSSRPPSGIPRASRLPVLNKRSSPNFPTKKEDELAVPAPRLQKRSSIASFSRSTTTVPKQGTGPPRPPPSLSSTGLKQPLRTSTGPKAFSARPSSRGNQQRRAPSPAKVPLHAEDEENHDQLSSLDSFRSASRQGFHDESPLDPPELSVFGNTAPLPKERKASRPSLSDRTMESLQNLPATPKERRRSSFFTPLDSPMGPPARPASSMSRNGSDRGSRPGTSDGTFANAVGRPSSQGNATSQSAKPAKRTSLGGFGFTPRTSSRLPSISKPDGATGRLPPPPRSPSPSKRVIPAARHGPTPGRVSGSKTLGARVSKPRTALSDAYGPAVQSAKAREDSVTAPVSQTPAASPAPSKRNVSGPTNSSAVLRQQIAAAKAAAREQKAKQESPQTTRTGAATSFDFDLQSDPFNNVPQNTKHILRNRINSARMDGKLNIAAMGLKSIPSEVMSMYDAAAMEASKVSWAEVVDLSRFIAADNEMEEIEDEVFPDASADDFAADDDSAGNQFGGLEMLDLHINKLRVLPLGLRRLERLTTLNLSHNKLENDALDVVSQIKSLKTLKLGNNSLSGNLPASICELTDLDSLDVQSNRLLGLPEALRELVNLKMLNISGNQLTTLPMEALQDLRLIELDASSNALIGSLFPVGSASAHPTLRSLKVANNSLAALTFAEMLDLPRLQTLDLSNNNLTSLPTAEGWTELITLMATDNKIKELPAGFSTLEKLMNVNLSSNDIRLLDPEIANMENLRSLVLTSNPLRDKKFLTMSADDIKRDLKARLAPAETDGDAHIDDESNGHPIISATSSQPTTWHLKPNATLDLSSKILTDAVNDTLGSFLQTHEVKHLNLSANKLTAVPPALWLGENLSVLDLSGNALGSDYLYDKLELPCLRELKIARCSITTLEPLMSGLVAPKLETMDVAANRLTGSLPVLREMYPSLTMLLASDNKFSAVSAEALRGMRTVTLQSNAIKQLPAEIGLLWDEGLKSFEVGSNAFRVPNYRVLEKGTEALMRWLRNKVPAADGAA